jgi:phosphatidate cytidylyltransferase
MSLWFLVMLFLLIKELYNKQDNPINTLAYTFFGQIYIGLSMMFLARMGFSGNAAEDSNYSPVFLMSFFVLIWSCDTGAYMVGSTLGKHRMFERLSPKKSWEGFFGGLLFTVIAAIIISMLFPGYLSLSKWIIFALITVAFDTWGDLVESMIKRSLKVKDSGNMIPGHGGILDRLDSCLLAAPAVVIYLMFFL